MAESTRSWFTQELETTAIWWRIERADGVTLGFTSHDRDLAIEGVVHRTAPGMVPSAIRRTADLDADSAEIAGALSHDSISEGDLAAGRFDGASVTMGMVDWSSLEKSTLYSGTLGAVSHEGTGFSAELKSMKELLQRQVSPRTSPSCRAEFCGIGCTLSAPRFTIVAQVIEISEAGERLRIAGLAAPTDYRFGLVRWLDGPDAGLWRRIEDVDGAWLITDHAAHSSSVDLKVLLRQGCDHTIATCSERFGNAVNFQGEPYLPGNDMLGRYPAGQS